MRVIRSHRAAASVAVAAVLLVVVGAPGAAQGGVGALLPGAATMGAPDWVVPGTRVTFYTAGASVANAEHQWQEDADGGWADPVTGKRYSQTEATTASGEGYFQVDVIGIDGPDVALQWVSFGLDRAAGRFFGGSGGGAREPGAAPEDFWLHPSLLADIPEANLQDLKVMRGDYTVEGNTYQGLGIVNRDPNRYSSLIYDLTTGLLLSATTRAQANASPLHVLAGQDPPDANTALSIVRIAGVRQRDVPGLASQPPSWAQPGTVLQYTGTRTFVNPYDATHSPSTYPAQMTVTLSAGGPTWLAYRTAVVADIAGYADTSQGSGVAGASGPYWVAPDVLGALREGQVQDEDPVTGQRLSVSWVGAGTLGQAATIVAALPGISSTSTYDLTTGVLLAVSHAEAGTGITTELQLQSVR